MANSRFGFRTWDGDVATRIGTTQGMPYNSCIFLCGHDNNLDGSFILRRITNICWKIVLFTQTTALFGSISGSLKYLGGV
jgi:hypothetical protein